jgi:hypothetical protein
LYEALLRPEISLHPPRKSILPITAAVWGRTLNEGVEWRRAFNDACQLLQLRAAKASRQIDNIRCVILFNIIAPGSPPLLRNQSKYRGDNTPYGGVRHSEGHSLNGGKFSSNGEESRMKKIVRWEQSVKWDFRLESRRLLGARGCTVRASPHSGADWRWLWYGL